MATVAAAGTAAVQTAQATADTNNAAAVATQTRAAAQLATDQGNATALLAKIKADVQDRYLWRLIYRTSRWFRCRYFVDGTDLLDAPTDLKG